VPCVHFLLRIRRTQDGLPTLFGFFKDRLPKCGQEIADIFTELAGRFATWENGIFRPGTDDAIVVIVHLVNPKENITGFVLRAKYSVIPGCHPFLSIDS
jgi:hypothetical protein